MRLRALFIVFSCIQLTKTQLQAVIPAEWDTVYNKTTGSNMSLTVFRFAVPEANAVARITISSSNSTAENPLLVVTREKQAIMSLQVPLIANFYEYSQVARTLCPFTDYKKGEVFTVEVSSFLPVNFEFQAKIVHNLLLHKDSIREVTASASEPVFLRYDIPEGVDSVAVHMTSLSTSCMTVSVQKIACPVSEMPDNVNSVGMHQTMTKSATIPVERSQMSSFYVVFVVNNNDDLCSDYPSIKPKKPTKFPLRTKSFNVTIESSVNHFDYILPITFWAGILCITTFFVLLYHSLDGKWERRFIANAYTHLEDHAESERARDFYDLQRMREDDDLRDYDTLPDVKDMMVVRAKSRLTVADLSMKDYQERERQYDVYKIALVVIFIFYNITVVQLLISKASSSRGNGNLDECAFNYQCARPLWIFTAFNNVISNAGYICIGVLIIAMNYGRTKAYRRLQKVQPSLSECYGVPHHSGLMTAIGLAVIMEGISSASYHVCPNNINYQFDTALMYVIGMLGKLKIWSLRHPDMVVEAYHAFGFLGIFIIAAIVGVYVHNFFFWIVFSLMYVASMLLISLEFYFKGIWSLNLKELKNSIHYAWASSRWFSCLVPAFKARFFVILLLNLANITVVFYGLSAHPKDFLSFLLIPFNGNLFIYIIYYILMKMFHCERIPKRATALLILAVLFWGIAAFFFTHHVSDWSKMPAISRELNQPCIFLNFYDNHDLWHLTSAFAIFFSFTAINVIDDDLLFNLRRSIVVF